MSIKYIFFFSLSFMVHLHGTYVLSYKGFMILFLLFFLLSIETSLIFTSTFCLMISNSFATIIRYHPLLSYLRPFSITLRLFAGRQSFEDPPWVQIDRGSYRKESLWHFSIIWHQYGTPGMSVEFVMPVRDG